MTLHSEKTQRHRHIMRIAALIGLLALAVSAAGLTACSRFRYVQPGTQLYLAHNLWDSGSPREIRSINFKKGTMIPAGTPVSRAATGGLWIRFIVNGRWHKILFIRKYHPGVSARTVAGRLFTSKTFDELTAKFTEDEIRYIKSGEIGPGMSKEAVLVSWGYPPEHKTRSTGEDLWVYYRTRFHAVKVWFDAHNRVSEVKG